MDGLIKYIAAENKIKIDSYTQYVNNICSCIQDNGMVVNMLTEPEYTKKVTQLPSADGRRISYEIMYDNVICGISYTWYINIDFYERMSGTELQINITSQTYMLSVGEEYLTKLEQLIEECICSDWGVLVRVIDAYSDMLNVLLFPEIHRFENSLRRVVSCVMSSVYGAQWWKDGKNETFAAVKNGYAVSDETVLSMHVDDFDKIITGEWKDCFSKYFTDGFIDRLHGLADAYKKVFSNHKGDKDFYFSVKGMLESANSELITVIWKVEHTL